MSLFFNLYRKRGFGLTLELLEKCKDHKAKESDFFQTLKDNESYLNEFYRVKKDLLNHQLIEYTLDDNYDKVIALTKKGEEVLDKINAIEVFLGDNESKAKK